MTNHMWLEPDLRVLRANNPSPMTGQGTNTFMLGQGEVCIIDPGPDDPAHLAALRGALADGEKVVAILITHSHLDHSALARKLSGATGAPVLAYGDSLAGRSAVMQTLARSGLAGGGEGVDPDFQPDQKLSDQQMLQLGQEQLQVLWTPGHMGNHVCFCWRDVIFTGDHVMGWSSSLVSPPDGDMGAYMRSLARVQAIGARRLYPAHGDPIAEPQQHVAALHAHRMQREDQILALLSHGPRTISEIVGKLYHDTPLALHKAAARNVLAHLIDLWERQIVAARPDLASDAVFELLARR